MRSWRPHFERAVERGGMAEKKQIQCRIRVSRTWTDLIVERRNLILGITGLPFPSTGASMEKTDNIVAMAIQTVSSAMLFPAHELDMMRGLTSLFEL